VKGNVTIQMKNVPWDQALDTVLSIMGLGKRQAGNVITVMSLDKIKKDDADRLVAIENKRKADAEQARPAAEPLVTRVVNVDYTDAKKLTENLLDLLPKDKDGKVQGSVKVDEHSNSLIIQATRQDMSRLFPIIEKIDKPTAQILIKANIVETTKDTARNLGVQWGGMWGQKVGNQGLYVTPGGMGGSAVPPGSAFSGAYSPTSGAAGISGQGYGVNFPAAMASTATASLGLMFGTIGENILEVQLSALQKNGKLNIISSPSITTLDNQPAFTENGEKVPFVTTEVGSTGTVRKVDFVNAVLRLEITPHVIDGKKLKMRIKVQKDEADASRNVDGNPYIIKKQTETNLIVEDGETIVISGLTKQTKTENVSGVPWFKDIPGLGWLFKGESTDDNMQEVLIFITPSIMRPQEVAGIQTGP
jgi:type IV pilus assembly protein PilQ